MREETNGWYDDMYECDYGDDYYQGKYDKEFIRDIFMYDEPLEVGTIEEEPIKDESKGNVNPLKHKFG